MSVWSFSYNTVNAYKPPYFANCIFFVVYFIGQKGEPGLVPVVGDTCIYIFHVFDKLSYSLVVSLLFNMYIFSK